MCSLFAKYPTCQFYPKEFYHRNQLVLVDKGFFMGTFSNVQKCEKNTRSELFFTTFYHQFRSNNVPQTDDVKKVYKL